VTEKQDRPAILTRSKPQPAPDYKDDPIPEPKVEKPRRPVASAKKEDILELPPPQELQPVFNFSTRLSQEVMALLKEVTDNGVSKRAAVEHAIRVAYGKGKKP
jgi:hypothetical protein